MEIEEIRKRIAECDLGIVKLIAERNGLAAEIGKEKKFKGLGICVPSVEEKVIERYVENGMSEGISEETMRKIASLLLEESKKVQEKIINDKDKE